MKKEWPKVRLGEVLRPVSRVESVDALKEYRLLGVRLDGQGPFLRETVSGTQTSATKLHQVAKGDFIYSRLFASRGAFGVIDHDLDGCHVSGEFPTFTAAPGRIDVNFLSYWFRLPTTIARVNEDCAGSTPLTRNRFKEQFFLALEIPLPSLAEQRCVVTRIEELAAQIHEARSLRQQAEREAAALPLSVAHSMLAAVDSLRTRLGDWVDTAREGIQTGPFGAQLNSSEFIETGTPVLTIGNVQYGGLDTANLRFVSEMKAAQLARYQVSEGDILFARMGTVGRCCVVPSLAQGWLINYHIIRVALDKQRIDPQFVHWTIRASADVECYLRERIRGATREGVNSEIVAGLPCRVPPLSEQRRIVAELDALQAETNRLKSSQGESAVELGALLPAILDQAFKGEL